MKGKELPYFVFVEFEMLNNADVITFGESYR